MHLGVPGQQCLINPLTNAHQPKSLINPHKPVRMNPYPSQSCMQRSGLASIHTQGCLTDASTNTFSLQATYLWQGSPVTFQGRSTATQSTFITNLGPSPAFPNRKVKHTMCTAHLVTCCLNSLCCCIYRIPSLPPQLWGVENHLPLL